VFVNAQHPRAELIHVRQGQYSPAVDTAQSSKLITFRNGRWPYFQLAFLALFWVGVNTRIRWKRRSFRRIATTPQLGHPGGWSVSTMTWRRPSAVTVVEVTR
jgi:hypothetical protein